MQQAGCEVSIVLPCLNEEENLKTLLPQLDRANWEIIVSDGGSTDLSREVVSSLIPMREARLRLIVGDGSVSEAITRGIKSSVGKFIVVMDSDGSHPVDAIPKIVDALCVDNIVAGSRYILPNSSTDTRLNQLISKLGNLVTKPLAPRITDRMAGMFGIRREVAKVSIKDTAKPMLEYIVRSGTGLYSEVPIVFQKRLNGKSKIGRHPKILLKTLVGVGLLYLCKFRRPLRFLVTGFVGVFINLFLLWLFTEKLGVYYLLSSAMAICLTTAYSYLVNNFWTFEKDKLV